MEPHPSIQGSISDFPLVSCGVSGVVFKASESVVLKATCGTDESRQHLAVERANYERLGSHPYITKFLFTHKGMIVLERLQYPLRKRLWDLRDAGERPRDQDVLRWASQVSITPLYPLAWHWNGDVKLSDFAGSSLDGSAPGVVPGPHSEQPDFPATQPSMKSEIFAIGSTLYEIQTTRHPYHDKPEEEVERLFRQGVFPGTVLLILGSVITRCWNLEYEDVGKILSDIQRISNDLENKDAKSSHIDGRVVWRKKTLVPQRDM
ncbi:hypothetical protein AJ80_01162 [Polytolypa hystricis UAMH7299]|uniref:Protein kinase domain-containing protein n=1 Tax=Polytolypa hystricis (strain UAMH7299) TaxID=1447883 RepID=A0A2B7Z0T4_POLH7|nr:hypothetical protein AJ80_01162 [Polytolypa hystricis UAMH7299]